MTESMTLFLMMVISQALFTAVVIGVVLWLDRMHERDICGILGQLNTVHALLLQMCRQKTVDSNQEQSVDCGPFAVHHTNGAHTAGPRPPKVVTKHAPPVIVKYESDYPRCPTVFNVGPIGKQPSNGEWGDMPGFGG